MARRKTDVIISDRGNDHKFTITEMPASKLESWLIRAFLAMASSGVSTPDGSNIKEAAVFVAKNGIKALANLDYEKASPLLAELLECCERDLGNGAREQISVNNIDNILFDVMSLLKLRMEVLKLNLGFLLGEGDGLHTSPEKQHS